MGGEALKVDYLPADANGNDGGQVEGEREEAIEGWEEGKASGVS
jgi:hypothetical protein